MQIRLRDGKLSLGWVHQTHLSKSPLGQAHLGEAHLGEARRGGCVILSIPIVLSEAEAEAC